MQKFYLNISKSRFKQVSKVQSRTRPRAMQVYFAMLLWLNRRDSLSLGVEYYYGRSRGRLCYYKDLKRKISNWTGLEHKQIVRYLREFEKKGTIYRDDNQVSLDGVVRPQFFLNPAADLRPRKGEQYLRVGRQGFCRKGFDICAYLEKSMEADSHPAEQDQLQFNISKIARWYRAKPKQYKPKKKRKKRKKGKKTFIRVVGKGYVPFYGGRIAKKMTTGPLVLNSLKSMNQPTGQKVKIRKMTPIENHNPDSFCRMNLKTTYGKKNFKKRYEKKICLIHKKQKIWVNWWKTKIETTEFVKNRAGLAYSDKALWHGGKLYRQKDPKNDPYSYEFVGRPRRDYKPVAGYGGPAIPSMEQTRRNIADSLGLSLEQYHAKLRQDMKRDNARRGL